MFGLFKKRDKITTVKDPTKRAIIDFLKENDHSTYGEIIKNLSLSSSNGLRHINELKEKGIISNKIMPPFYKLA